MPEQRRSYFDLLNLNKLCEKVRPRWWQETQSRDLPAEALYCALKENA